MTLKEAYEWWLRAPGGNLAALETYYKEGLTKSKDYQLLAYIAIGELKHLDDKKAAAKAFKEAQKLSDEAMKVDPNDVYAWVVAGMYADSCEMDRKKEVALLERALQIDPGFVEGWRRLGMAAQTFDKKKAMDAFERALALEPTNLAVIGTFASFKSFFMKDNAGALPLLEEVLSMKPNDTGTMMHKATVLKQLGRQREALETFEQVARINPSEAMAPFFIAQLKAAMGDQQGASESMSRVAQGSQIMGVSLGHTIGGEKGQPGSAPPTKFCSACGRELGAAAKFCMKCGKQVG